ncbi:MAG: hypothetical protein AB3N16_02755 [Flavobacteriaceae bacterium]
MVELTQHKNEHLLRGTRRFQKELNKIFSSEVLVREHPGKEDETLLTIEVDMDLNFNQFLTILEGDILKRSQKNTQRTMLSLMLAFIRLQEENKDDNLDLEELSFYLRETTIHIKRISPKSILIKLFDILRALVEHAPYYTEAGHGMPASIYVPIYRTDYFTNASMEITRMHLANAGDAYFDYWGICIDEEDDGQVYDLKSAKIAPEGFDLIF